MRKEVKPYLVNLSVEQKKFAQEMAWRRRQRLSEYFRHLIDDEMRKHPDVVEIVNNERL